MLETLKEIRDELRNLVEAVKNNPGVVVNNFGSPLANIPGNDGTGEIPTEDEHADGVYSEARLLINKVFYWWWNITVPMEFWPMKYGKNTEEGERLVRYVKVMTADAKVWCADDSEDTPALLLKTCDLKAKRDKVFMAYLMRQGLDGGGHVFQLTEGNYLEGIGQISGENANYPLYIRKDDVITALK